MLYFLLIYFLVVTPDLIKGVQVTKLIPTVHIETIYSYAAKNVDVY